MKHLCTGNLFFFTVCRIYCRADKISNIDVANTTNIPHHDHHPAPSVHRASPQCELRLVSGTCQAGGQAYTKAVQTNTTVVRATQGTSYLQRPQDMVRCVAIHPPLCTTDPLTPNDSPLYRHTLSLFANPYCTIPPPLNRR